jgi:histidine triad (HIT) family protein
MEPDCIFCQIVRGEAPASVVYDDAGILAFMNRFQSVPGHVLVVPKVHVENIYALSEPLAGFVFAAATRIARAVKRSLEPDGITLLQNNEPAGGQEIGHFHLHVIARRAGEPFFQDVERQPAERAHLDRLAAEIRAALAHQPRD